MSQKSLENKFRPLLQKVSLKVTNDRLAILSILEKSKKPLSIKDIKQKISSTKVDQATIYRTMELLVKFQLVRLVNLQHSHNHYELSDNNKHHHHLICESCGKIIDISSCDTTKIEKQVKQIGNFALINNHALEFFGICKSCYKKMDS